MSQLCYELRGLGTGGVCIGGGREEGGGVAEKGRGVVGGRAHKECRMEWLAVEWKDRWGAVGGIDRVGGEWQR